MSAIERIRSLYEPQLFEQLGTRLIAQLADHFRQVEAGNGPVLNWRNPADNVADAASILNQPLTGSIAERFEQLASEMIGRGQNLHHPRYIGHQVPASVPLAGLFQCVVAVLNQVMAVYEMGPWITSMERTLVDLWGERIGLKPGTFAGCITNGGSLANLTALLTARNVALADAWEAGLSHYATAPVLLVQSDAHYCIARAAGILGLGTWQVQRVPLNVRRQMDLEALRKMLTEQRSAQRPVVAVVASACATPIGAFDELHAVADVCEEFGVWMHVDAAHGGATAFSDKYRHLIAGLERADSFICDAHKTMFVPALCAFVFYKNRGHRFEAFRQEAPYLFDPSAPGMAEFDSGMLTVECTKQGLSAALWGMMALCGPELFGDLIDLTFDKTREFHDILQAAPDFEPLHEPQCNIQVFRYVPEAVQEWTMPQIGEFNRQIRRAIIESGEFYIVQTNLNGEGALRACVMNPLTETSDLLGLLDGIRRQGERLLA